MAAPLKLMCHVFILFFDCLGIFHIFTEKHTKICNLVLIIVMTATTILYCTQIIYIYASISKFLSLKPEKN